MRGNVIGKEGEREREREREGDGMDERRNEKEQ